MVCGVSVEETLTKASDGFCGDTKLQQPPSVCSDDRLQSCAIDCDTSDDSSSVSMIDTGSSWGLSEDSSIFYADQSMHSFFTIPRSFSMHSFCTPAHPVALSRNYSFDSKRSMDSKSRKRKLMPSDMSGEQLFDKLPNYYTALSIPARAVAGSAAHSSSDLITELVEQGIRDLSPDHESHPMLDKIPAYQSTFTNSTRYDMLMDAYDEPEDVDATEYSYEDLENDSKFKVSIDYANDAESQSIAKSMLQSQQVADVKHVCAPYLL